MKCKFCKSSNAPFRTDKAVGDYRYVCDGCYQLNFSPIQKAPESDPIVEYIFESTIPDDQKDNMVLTLRKRGFVASRESYTLRTDATLESIALAYGSNWFLKPAKNTNWHIKTCRERFNSEVSDLAVELALAVRERGAEDSWRWECKNAIAIEQVLKSHIKEVEIYVTKAIDAPNTFYVRRKSRDLDEVVAAYGTKQLAEHHADLLRLGVLGNTSAQPNQPTKEDFAH